ncbi:MAG: hypothetical protein FJX72_01930 [Armatimonadetes bacterium]|nr:hypothetical protein [Armatimonadota bacterium]
MTGRQQHPAMQAQVAVDRDELVEAVRREAQRRLRKSLLWHVPFGLAVALITINQVASWLGFGRLWGPSTPVIPDKVLLIICGCAIPFWLTLLGCRLRLALIDRAAGADVRRVLLAARDTLPTEASAARTQLLCHELRRVTADDEAHLTGRNVRVLGRILTSEVDPHDLRMAALSALRYVADEQAASQVAAIANAPIRTRHDEALRRAARRYLPEIRARLNQRRESDRLLRPAEPPPVSTLLRPVEGAPKGDETLLVRPLKDAVKQEQSEA